MRQLATLRAPASGPAERPTAVVHKPAPRVVAPAGLNACHMRPSASVPIARVDLAVRRPLLRGARAGRNGRCASGVAPRVLAQQAAETVHRGRALKQSGQRCDVLNDVRFFGNILLLFLKTILAASATTSLFLAVDSLHVELLELPRPLFPQKVLHLFQENLGACSFYVLLLLLLHLVRRDQEASTLRGSFSAGAGPSAIWTPSELNNTPSERKRPS